MKQVAAGSEFPQAPTAVSGSATTSYSQAIAGVHRCETASPMTTAHPLRKTASYEPATTPDPFRGTRMSWADKLQLSEATVVIASDQPDTRMLLRAVLTPLRCRIVEAATSVHAWYAIRLERPAVVILDLGMSGIDGLQLLRLMRRSRALDATKLLVLSEHAAAEKERAARGAGADAFLPKPFPPSALRNAVRQFIEAADLTQAPPAS